MGILRRSQVEETVVKAPYMQLFKWSASSPWQHENEPTPPGFINRNNGYHPAFPITETWQEIWPPGSMLRLNLLFIAVDSFLSSLVMRLQNTVDWMAEAPNASDFAVQGEQALVALDKVGMAKFVGNFGSCIFEGDMLELLVHGDIEVFREVV